MKIRATVDFEFSFPSLKDKKLNDVAFKELLTEFQWRLQRLTRFELEHPFNQVFKKIQDGTIDALESRKIESLMGRVKRIGKIKTKVIEK